MSAFYDYFKRNGICEKCFTRKARPGRTLCAECAKDHSRKGAKLRAERIARGLCTVCGEPAAPGSTMCAECFAKSRLAKPGREPMQEVGKNDL